MAISARWLTLSLISFVLVKSWAIRQKLGVSAPLAQDLPSPLSSILLYY
jgi:hypothetical protein